MPIATNPVAGDVHVNVPLTNFSQKYLQNLDGFVALRAFPNAPVMKQSDLYYEFDRDDFLRDEAQERADGTESAGGSFSVSTNPYFAHVYAFHKDVTDRQRTNADNQVALDNSAVQYVTRKLLIRRERLFQDTFIKTGVWGTDNSTAYWGDASSDPIADVRAAKTIVQKNTGMRPNKMVIGRTALDTVLDNDSILARISGGSTAGQPALVQLELLAQAFELDAIYVMDAIYTSSVKGAATTTRAFIGGDSVLLYYAPDTVGLEEPTAGVQFSWTGLLGNTDSGTRVKRIRAELLEADRIEGEMAFDYKLTGSDLGYFFNTVSLTTPE
jgi:hypothetical protein